MHIASIRTLIKRLIQEELGDHRFEEGTVTPQASELIAYVYNTYPVFDFAISHPDDPKVVFDMAKNHYEKHRGPLGGDEETVMYDFMANFKTPNSNLEREAQHIFGSHFGAEVVFAKQAEDGQFTVYVNKAFARDAQQLADRAGYTLNLANDKVGEQKLLMKARPKNDDVRFS